MLSYISHMSGPAFLMFYALWIAAIFSLTALYARRLIYPGTLPELLKGREDLYELAYLHRGQRGLYEVAVVKLFKAGLLKEVENQVRVLRTDQEAVEHFQEPLNGIESAALKHFAAGNPAKSAPDFLEHHFPDFESRLVRKGLLISLGQWSRFYWASVAGLGAIMILGVYKLAAALLTGHFNVLFLCLMLVFAGVAYAYVFLVNRVDDPSFPIKKRWTDAGKNLLHRIGSSCPAREWNWKDIKAAERFDYSMLIPLAVLGAAAMPDSAHIFGVEHLRQNATAASGGCTVGGCGSAGGCSGGCGGGCGGCGGCG